MSIDFVIPWVNGDDPDWFRQCSRYLPAEEIMQVCRFRDWGILKYWFRAVERYAPWVNKIYFITDGQVPGWINSQHPKLRVIDHRDYIPGEYLPTFSSHTIELNLHRIDGLSEQFVYFNDDMFLNRPVTPEDFFRNGLPCDCAILDAFCPTGYLDAYCHAQCNVMAFINAQFHKKDVIRQNPGKWLSSLYGKGILKNLYYYPSRYFSNFQNGHIPSSMLRSTFDTVWELEPELLDKTCRHKFRELGDMNQYIMSYYNLCTGQFTPRSPRFGRCYQVGKRDAALYEDIRLGIHKVICINDNPYVADFDTEKAKLAALYEQKLPQKCAYEL